MRAYILKLLSEDPKIMNLRLRNGFMVFFLAFLALQIFPLQEGKYGGLVVPIILILNHLAFQYYWPKTLTIALRVIALLWLIFAFFTLFMI
jgi:hypothetical protein